MILKAIITGCIPELLVHFKLSRRTKVEGDNLK